uniref:Trans-sialidase-like protein n=1 Tax=Trypanosoma carassii TaxID=38249 RepID=Q8I672_9TRYP|nr:trans-sialidase-like protein precursor [Trypanosoma carassii]
MQTLLLGVVVPLLLCFGSVILCADGGKTTRSTLFQGYEWTKVSRYVWSEYDQFVYSYHAPILANVKGTMVAVAEARYKHYISGYAGEIMAKYSTDQGKTWGTIVAIPRKTNWKYARSVDPTMVPHKDSLLIFAERFEEWNYDWTDYKSGGGDFVYSLSYNVTHIKGRSQRTALEFYQPTSLISELSNEIDRLQIKRLIGGYGRGIEVNGTSVVPVWYINTKGEMRPAVLRYEKPYWKFSKGTGDAGSLESSIVEWEGKLIMNARTNDGYRKVYESTDMGNTWKEALGSLSRVWGNSPNRDGYGCSASSITITIEDTPVMLFSHPLNTKGGGSRDRLHLWVTDNKRIYDVGQISEHDENTGHSSLLYTNGNLYCLYEKDRYGTQKYYSSVLANLVDELEKIKEVVKAWKEQDKMFAKPRVSGVSTPSYPGSTCDVSIPTNGLVGFLSNDATDPQWKDAYRCVDANIRGGVKVPNGLMFKGAGAGAMWPVMKQGQNRPYHFVNHEFTLAATVTIHECTSNTPSSILGLVLASIKPRRFMYLSCTKDGRLHFNAGLYSRNSGLYFNVNETFRVVMTLTDGELALYIDGKQEYSCGLSLTSGLMNIGISHFCFVRCTNTSEENGGSVTVTNALLYNRVLTKKEISRLYMNTVKVTQESRLKGLMDLGGLITNPSVVKPTPIQTAPEGEPKAHVEKASDSTSSKATNGVTETTYHDKPLITSNTPKPEDKPVVDQTTKTNVSGGAEEKQPEKASVKEVKEGGQTEDKKVNDEKKGGQTEDKKDTEVQKVKDKEVEKKRSGKEEDNKDMNEVEKVQHQPDWKNHDDGKGPVPSGKKSNTPTDTDDDPIEDDDAEEDDISSGGLPKVGQDANLSDLKRIRRELTSNNDSSMGIHTSGWMLFLLMGLCLCLTSC